MKSTSHCPHGQFASRRASRYLVWAALLAAPMAQAQNNTPVTGSMLQETPEQRARMEQAARQAQADEQARRAAAAQQQAAQQQAAQAQREAQLRAAQQRAASTSAAPAAARPASSVVRQVPGPSQAPAAAAQAAPVAPVARPQVVQAPEQRVTTVVTPQAAAPAQPAPAVVAPAATAAAPRATPVVDTASVAPQGKSRPNGDVTSEVLRMQAEGRQAGQALPMLGATASPSWKRYIDSYSHPIPEFYETTSQPKQ